MKKLFGNPWAAIVSVVILIVFAPSENRAAEKPNVIVIMADDLGYETLGTYGGASYDTPVLDRLAANGVRFDHAHAQPLCTPTRVSLMTGKYNWRNWHSFGILKPEAQPDQVRGDAEFLH